MTQPPGADPTDSAPEPAAPEVHGKAIASLVCAVLGFFALPLLGPILAVVLARAAERAIDQGQGDFTGYELASAARTLAAIQFWLFAVALTAVMGIFVLARMRG